MNLRDDPAAPPRRSPSPQDPEELSSPQRMPQTVVWSDVQVLQKALEVAVEMIVQLTTPPAPTARRQQSPFRLKPSELRLRAVLQFSLILKVLLKKCEVLETLMLQGLVAFGKAVEENQKKEEASRQEAVAATLAGGGPELNTSLLPPGLDDEDYHEERCFLNATSGNETAVMMMLGASSSTHSDRSPVVSSSERRGEAAFVWLRELLSKLLLAVLPITALEERSGLPGLRAYLLSHPPTTSAEPTCGPFPVGSPLTLVPPPPFATTSSSCSTPAPGAISGFTTAHVNPLLSVADVPLEPPPPSNGCDAMVVSPVVLTADLPAHSRFSLRVLFASLRWNVGFLWWRDCHVERCASWLAAIDCEALWSMTRELEAAMSPASRSPASLFAADLSEPVLELLSWRQLTSPLSPPTTATTHTKRLLRTIAALRDCSRLLLSCAESPSDVITCLHYLHTALRHQEDFLMMSFLEDRQPVQEQDGEDTEWQRAVECQADSIAKVIMFLHMVVEYALSHRTRYLLRRHQIRSGVYTHPTPPAAGARRPEGDTTAQLEERAVRAACSELVHHLTRGKCRTLSDLEKVGSLPSASYEPLHKRFNALSSPSSHHPHYSDPSSSASPGSSLVDPGVPLVLAVHVLQIILHFSTSYRSCPYFESVAAHEAMTFHQLLCETEAADTPPPPLSAGPCPYRDCALGNESSSRAAGRSSSTEPSPASRVRSFFFGPFSRSNSTSSSSSAAGGGAALNPKTARLLQAHEAAAHHFRGSGGGGLSTGSWVKLPPSGDLTGDILGSKNSSSSSLYPQPPPSQQFPSHEVDEEGDGDEVVLPSRGKIPLLPEEGLDRVEDAEFLAWRQSQSQQSTAGGSEGEDQRRSLRLLTLLKRAVSDLPVTSSASEAYAELETISSRTLMLVTSELNKALYLLPRRLRRWSDECGNEAAKEWWHHWTAAHQSSEYLAYTKALHDVLAVEEKSVVEAAGGTPGGSSAGQPKRAASSAAATSLWHSRAIQALSVEGIEETRKRSESRFTQSLTQYSHSATAAVDPAAQSSDFQVDTARLSVLWDTVPFFLPEIRVSTSFTSASVETQENLRRYASDLAAKQAAQDDIFRQQSAVAGETMIVTSPKEEAATGSAQDQQHLTSLRDTVLAGKHTASSLFPTFDVASVTRVVSPLCMLEASGRHALHGRLPFSCQFSHWNMLYNTVLHGMSLHTLYQCCADGEGLQGSSRLRPVGAGGRCPALLLIEVMPSTTTSFAQDGEGVRHASSSSTSPANRLVIGAYLSDGIVCGTKRYYGSSDCFVFQMFYCGDEAVPQLKMFKASGSNDRYISSSKSCIVVGGGDGGGAIYIDQGISHGATMKCPTFGSPPLTEWSASLPTSSATHQSFTVLRLEVIGFSS